MRRLLIAALALVLLRGDMFQDASNAKLPNARVELGVAPQVSAESFGMKGDGVSASGITTTAGSATFGGLSLTSADVGKLVWVPGAGLSGAPLITTIASPTSFATPAVNAVPATWYASDRCDVVAKGTGYVPGDTITMAGTAPTQCSVFYVTAVTATVNNGGSMASPPPDGTRCDVRTTSFTGESAAEGHFIGQIVAGKLAGPLSIYHGGAYTLNVPPLTGEPVVPENELCPGLTGATVNLTMGILHARRLTNGAYTAPPANPVSQASSSGSGTGATFNLTYTQSGAVQYGTNNLAGLQAVFGQTGNQTVHIPAGSYLTSSCATLAAASGISLIGDGRKNTTILLPSECLLVDSKYMAWVASTGRPTIRGLTLDVNNAIRRVRNVGASLLDFGNTTIFIDDIAILNASVQQWGILLHGASNGSVIQNSFFHMRPDVDLMRCIALSDGVVQAPGTPSPIQNARIINNTCDGSGIQTDGDRTLAMGNEMFNLRKGAGIKTIGGAGLGQSMAPMLINNIVRDSPLVSDVNNTIPEGMEIVSDDAIIMGNTFTNLPGPGITNFGNRTFIANNKCENTGLYHSTLTVLASSENDYAVEACIRTVTSSGNGTVTGNYSTPTGGLMYGYREDRRGGMTALPTYVFANQFVGKIAPTLIVNPATIASNIAAPNFGLDGTLPSGFAGNVSAPSLSSGSATVAAFRGYLSRPTVTSTFNTGLTALYGYDSSPELDSTTMPLAVYNFAATNPDSGTGNGATSGAYSNFGFFATAKTAAAGVGGTVLNVGLRADVGTGASAGTTNRGVWITGNGGVGSTNYALYSNSTAPSSFAGPMSFTGLPTGAGAGGLAVCVDTAGVLYKKAACP